MATVFAATPAKPEVAAIDLPRVVVIGHKMAPEQSLPRVIVMGHKDASMIASNAKPAARV